MDLLKPHGPKRNHKKGIAASMLDAKRASAVARQTEYSKLTVSQKIAKLDAGGFHAKKQRAKLNALLGAGGV